MVMGESAGTATRGRGEDAWIEGNLRVQDRASEKLQYQIIEEIKEVESTKT